MRKRLNMFWKHFRLFRSHSGQAAVAVWVGVFLLQFLDIVAYYENRSVPIMQRLALYPVLLMVFRAGNRFSVRNQPFLRTRPLPASAPFATDALLPLGLYSLLPMLREIPLVMFYHFGFANLLWAWADFLILHTLFFAASWSLGALLPRLNSAGKAGLAAGVAGMVFAVSTLLAQGVDLPVSGDHFWGERGTLASRYLALAACNGLVLLGCGMAFCLRLRGRAALAFVYVLLLSAVSGLLWWIPTQAPRWIARLDVLRPLPPATESGLSFSTPSYWDQNNTKRYENHIEHEFSVIPVDHGRLTTDWAVAPEGAFVSAGTRTRFHHDWAPRQHQPPTMPLGQRVLIRMRQKDYPEWTGGGVEIETRFRILHLENITLAAGKRLGEWDLRAPVPIGQLHVTDASTKWRADPDPDAIFPFRVERRVKFAFRVENLFWKRVLLGRPDSFRLLFTFRNQPAGLPPVSLQETVRLKSRSGSGAFPKIAHQVLDASQNFHQSAPAEQISAAAREVEAERVDVVLAQPARTLRGRTTQYARLPAFQPDDSRVPPFRLAELPMGTWETEMLRLHANRRYPSVMEADALFQNLAQLPPETYREVLFTAAMREPRLSELILQNGWEQEALPVWLDLARQEIELPPAAIRGFLLADDPRLRESLVRNQSWRPNPVLLSAAQGDPEFLERLLAATRESAPRVQVMKDFYYKRGNSRSPVLAQEAALLWAGIGAEWGKYHLKNEALPYPGGQEVKPGGGTFDLDRRMMIPEDAP